MEFIEARGPGTNFFAALSAGQKGFGGAPIFETNLQHFCTKSILARTMRSNVIRNNRAVVLFPAHDIPRRIYSSVAHRLVGRSAPCQSELSLVRANFAWASLCRREGPMSGPLTSKCLRTSPCRGTLSERPADNSALADRPPSISPHQDPGSFYLCEL